MRLTEGIVVDSVLTFGKLRFSALRREVRKQNEDGTVSNEVKERTYNLKSSAQGRMIQVSIPANVPLREFAYDGRGRVGQSNRGYSRQLCFSRRNYCQLVY